MKRGYSAELRIWLVSFCRQQMFSGHNWGKKKKRQEKKKQYSLSLMFLGDLLKKSNSHIALLSLTEDVTNIPLKQLHSAYCFSLWDLLAFIPHFDLFDEVGYFVISYSCYIWVTFPLRKRSWTIQDSWESIPKKMVNSKHEGIHRKIRPMSTMLAFYRSVIKNIYICRKTWLQICTFEFISSFE